MSTIIQAFDYKYADRDWESEAAETFRVTKKVTSDYTSTFGRLTGSQETTAEYADAPANAPADPLTYPPYLFADGSWKRDPAYTFQTTLIKTATYIPVGLDAYQVTTTTTDPLIGATSSDVQTVNGMPPQVQTVNTALTALVVQPTFGTLTDACLDEFVDSKKSLNFKWAETDAEFARSARRAMQRDSAIIRTIKMATNPLIEIGDTIRLVDPKRTLDALHMVTGRSISHNLETGDSTMTLTLEYWVR